MLCTEGRLTKALVILKECRRCRRVVWRGRGGEVCGRMLGLSVHSVGPAAGAVTTAASAATLATTLVVSDQNAGRISSTEMEQPQYHIHQDPDPPP